MARGKKPVRKTKAGSKKKPAAKKPKTYKGKSLRKGGGGQFAKMEDAIAAKPGMTRKRAKGIAAARGREKYGKEEFQKMALRGKKRAARKRKQAGKK